MNKIISNYIKYKFTFNNNIKHSSYLYQKVFRSIYGYTQNVTKKDRQSYQYYRKGVISDIPFLRPGKNSIILPLNTEQKLLNFFNTGKSTTHNFREKGEYIIEYNINRVEINEIDIVRCLENYIENMYVVSIDGNNIKLIYELDLIINDLEHYNKYRKPNKDNLIKKLNFITGIDWFMKCENSSELIFNFLNKIKLVKEKFDSKKENNNTTKELNNIKIENQTNENKENLKDYTTKESGEFKLKDNIDLKSDNYQI